jgi:rhomboid protease GluP
MMTMSDTNQDPYRRQSPEADRHFDEPVVKLTDDMLEEPTTHRRIDFERGMSYLPRLTLLLIAANVIVFGWQLASGALASRQAMIDAGALEQQAVFRGEGWRLLSSVFLHGGFDHLLGNCIALFILGMACEHAFGVRRTLGIYLVSGLAGSLLSVAIEPGPTVGASGAIFGILGCVTVFLYRYRHQLHLRDGRVAAVLAVWALYQFATGFLHPYIANFAHLGGLIGGAATGLMWRPILIASADSFAPDAFSVVSPRTINSQRS